MFSFTKSNFSAAQWIDLQCPIVSLPGHLRNEFNFWNAHAIMNTSGLLQRRAPR